MATRMVCTLVFLSALTLLAPKSADAQYWGLSGNSGTSGSDFVGTIDRAPLRIATAGITALFVKPGSEVVQQTDGRHVIRYPGRVGIGISDPSFQCHIRATDQLGLAVDASSNGVGAGLQLRTTGPIPDQWELLATGGRSAQGARKLNVRHLETGRDILTFTREGRVGIGTVDPRSDLDVRGKATADELTITGGGDIAEPFEMGSEESPGPGTVMTIDPEKPGSLKVADKPYDRRVAGVLAGGGGVRPGIVLRKTQDPTKVAYVALAGVVFCKAEARNMPIEPGDLLTTSRVPGFAMKARDLGAAQGAIIGKSMARLNAGEGLIPVLVNLQ